MSSARFVFDTNVLVSTLLFPPSVPAAAFRKAQDYGRLLRSEQTFEELASVLARPKFKRHLDAEDRKLFLAAFVSVSELVLIAQRVAVCRDPKDDMILDLALNGTATLIVAGDEDLLSTGSFRAISIRTPAQFLAHSIAS